MMVRNGTWKSECIAYHVRATTAPEPGKRPGKGLNASTHHVSATTAPEQSAASIDAASE
jgi:hypothetical protein